MKLPFGKTSKIRPKEDSSFEERRNIFKNKIEETRGLIKSSLFETPIKPKQKPGLIPNLLNTFSVFRKKNMNRQETVEEEVKMAHTPLLKKKRDTNKDEVIEEILMSNVRLKVQRSIPHMETPAIEPYTRNIHKMSKVGANGLQTVSLEAILKRLMQINERIKKDQIKEKNLYLPGMVGEQSEPKGLDISTVRSKKKRKKLRKQLKIYDENYCIAMSFVKALSKSLLLLTNDKHEIPSAGDFELENMIALSNLNKEIYDYCEFIDVAPLVFQRIRFYDGISNDEFIRDIGFNDFKAIFTKKMQSLKEEKSTGKSGSVFFQSSNGKYFIKTIRVSEVAILKKTLESYYSHLKNNPDSLLSRYYGLHKMRFYKNKKLKKNFYLVIMNNVFHDGEKPVTPESIYDLKGSTYKRRTSEEKLRMKAAGKDLNFLDIIDAGQLNIKMKHHRQKKLLETISNDSNFLASCNIIDYR